ncbi:MAG: hypothetical protein AAGD10_20050 [Myxococcota bacterium]
MNRLLAHFERLGAIVLSPVDALRSVLSGAGGGAGDVLPWLILVTAVVEPIRVGHAFLVARVDLGSGASMLVQSFMGQWLPLGVVAIACAAFGVWARRSGRHPAGGDRAADAALLAGLPFVYLACAGALLDALGLDLRFLPHHRLAGPPSVLLLRLLVAFTWSGVLWFLLLRELWRGPTEASVHLSEAEVGEDLA